jgi:AraC-like DNA-binding protein
MKLEQCFIVNLDRNQNVPMHEHPSLELVYFLNGRGQTTVNGIRSEIRNYFFTVIPAGVKHDQINKTRVTSLCLKVSGSGLETYEGGWMDQGGTLARVLCRFEQEMKQKRPFYDEICHGLLDEIVGLTKRTILASRKKPEKAELVENAVAIIRDKEGLITVTELADHFCVSCDYLRHLFQEYDHLSPMRHIIHSRMEKAKTLLESSEFSITAIAAQCGFDDIHYFSRLFKKEISKSPLDYRTEKCK